VILRARTGDGTPHATQDASVTSRNLSAVLVMRIAQIPFLLLFAILVPRMMGAETYGQFALLIAIVTMLGSFVNLGIGDIFGRFVPEVQARDGSMGVKKLASNFLAFKTLFSLAVLAVIVPALHYVYLGSVPAASFIFVALIVLVVDWASVFFSLLFGQNRLVRYSVRDPLRRALSLVLILLLFPRFGLLGALFSTLLVDFAILLLGAHWTKASLSLRELRFNIAFLKPYLGFGITVYLAWFIMNLWQRTGNVLIHHMTQDSREVAYFDIANQFFLLALSITIIVLNSLIPMFSKFIAAGQEQKIHEWSNRLLRYMLIMNMLGFGAMAFLAGDLIPLLIGQEFSRVSPNAIMLLLAIFPAVFVQIGFVYALVYKKPARFLYALLVAYGVFTVVSLALVPRHLAFGCSVAIVLSYCIMAGLAIAPFRDRMSGLVGEGSRVIAPGAALMPLAFFKSDVMANIGLAAAFVFGYLALLFIFRIVKLDELREVAGALRGGRKPSA
jgi:O-antigen/teichoic acid export membrane protein